MENVISGGKGGGGGSNKGGWKSLQKKICGNAYLGRFPFTAFSFYLPSLYLFISNMENYVTYTDKKPSVTSAMKCRLNNYPKYSLKISTLLSHRLLTAWSVQIRSHFWSVFSCIESKYRKTRTRNNSVFGHFPRSVLLIKNVQNGCFKTTLESCF